MSGRLVYKTSAWPGKGVCLTDNKQVQTSCGYAVPYLALKTDPEDEMKQLPYLEDRQTLGHWANKQIDKDVMNDYRAGMNSRSLDGLPGLRVARRDKGEMLLLRDLEAQVKKRNGVQLVLVAFLSVVLTVATMYGLGLVKMPGAVVWFPYLQVFKNRWSLKVGGQYQKGM